MEDQDFVVSEDLVQSPSHKQPHTVSLPFDDLLSPPLRLHENPSNGCGGNLWPAGMVLAKYLLRQPSLSSLRKKTILELGAGAGLTGLALALALHTQTERPTATHFTLTDQTPMLPLMQQNIALNNLPPELVNAQVLDWGSEHLPIQVPDVILAADCVYFEPAFPLLLDTMAKLMGEETVCYFCFKKRRRADMRFVKDVKKRFTVEDIQDDPDKCIWSRQGLFLLKIIAKKI